jgi:hypothetical protein
MRLLALACEIVAREIYHAAARAEPVVEVKLLTKGLHGLGAEKMRATIQGEIDAAEPGRHDAVVLGYGLCSNGTEGIVAREAPVVVPRAHDCITLLLGSRERYAAEFNARPGTYYSSAGWCERDHDTIGPREPGIMDAMGLSGSYEEYVERYGRENAEYLMEVLRGGLKHYDRIAFIRTGLGGETEARREAEERAAREGWSLEVLEGDLSLVERLVSGDWDDGFVVLGPGEALAGSHDDRVMRCVQCPSA